MNRNHDPSMAERNLDTPIGTLVLRSSSAGLTHILFEASQTPRSPSSSGRAREILDQTEEELGEYFAHRRRTFTVALAPTGTDFQRQVWKALLEVPFGQTRSYRDIAARIARPRAVRAVGTANGANPLPIIVPCHRIVGANRRLTGYAGGLDRKRALLVLEGVPCHGDRLVEALPLALDRPKEAASAMR